MQLNQKLYFNSHETLRSRIASFNFSSSDFFSLFSSFTFEADNLSFFFAE